MKNKLAFTLAEVLITLGIIGVVAAMTIPTIMQNYQGKQTAGALKKVYSTLTQAYNMAVKDNGTPDNWGLVANGDQQGAKNILDTLAPYLNINQYCGNSNAGRCFKNITYKVLSNDPWSNINGMPQIAKARISDGTEIGTFSYGDCLTPMGSVQNVCGDIYVDVNGDKDPNQFGVDLFLFYLTKDRIVPYGEKDTYNFDTYCKTGHSSNGLGCTAWVIYNENLDYLKCPGTLSWTGPTQCN